MGVLLRLSSEHYGSIKKHLLQDRLEQVVFLFAEVRQEGENVIFDAHSYHNVLPEGFAFQDGFSVELTDEEKARVIKMAWDRRAALSEIHSHPTARGAVRFSPSDLAGLAEFIPHVWWRLKGKPYLAVVHGAHNLDALAWTLDPHEVQGVEGVLLGETVLRPTGITLRQLRKEAERDR